jgi:required for meiotic nuclear division protein 1
MMMPEPTIAQHTLYAYSRGSAIPLQELSNKFKPCSFQRIGPECLAILLKEPNQYLYAFRYGSIVLVNVAVAEHYPILEKADFSIATTRTLSTNENFGEDDFYLRISYDAPMIGFNYVTIPEWQPAMVALVCNSLAHSSALDLIERDVEKTLSRSESMVRKVKQVRGPGFRRSKLLQELATLLETRHRIFNQLSLLSEPDLAWESELAARIYAGLIENFDIKTRVERVEKNLGLIADVVELQLDIYNVRRSELLEVIIIVLIIVEILQSFFS